MRECRISLRFTLNDDPNTPVPMTDPATEAVPTRRAPRGGVHPQPSVERTDLRLTDISLDEVVELVRFEMPDDQIEPLLERGVLPGCRLCPVRRSPSGDPIVEVDGVMLALRRETAGCICVKRFAAAAD